MQVNGHVGIGADSAPNDKSLLLAGTVNSVLSLQEEFTDFTTDDTRGLINHYLLNPAAAVSDDIWAQDNRLETAANANNYTGTLRVAQNSFTHAGSGDITSLYGSDSVLVNSSTGDITDAIGTRGAITNSGGANIGTGTGVVSDITNSGTSTMTVARGFSGTLTNSSSNNISYADGAYLRVQNTGAGAIPTAKWCSRNCRKCWNYSSYRRHHNCKML